MDGNRKIIESALENPRVVENSIGISEMVANLSQLVDREIAIESVAEHLGVKKQVVLVSLAIAHVAISG